MIDKQDIGKRLFEVRKHFSFNQTEFANELEITQQTISQIEKGIIFSSLEIINNITSKHCISYEWLIDGVGSMLKEEKSKVIYNSVVKEPEVKYNSNIDVVKYLQKEISELKESINIKEKIIEILQKTSK